MQNQTTTAKLSASDRRRAITAASVGQFFELYDFSIYGFFGFLVRGGVNIYNERFGRGAPLIASG